MTVDTLFDVLGTIVVLAPVSLVSILGLILLFGFTPGEAAIARCTESSVVIGLVSAVGVLALMLMFGNLHVPIEFGNWVSLPGGHFHFHIKFVFDRLSVPFVILTFVLVGTVGAFANRYLHREPGYNRFFLFYAVFLFGMIVASLAGTIETLFMGWELVGLSSALLVAFFHERRPPVANGQRVWSIYRIADAAFLIAAVVMHHLRGEGDFSSLMGTGPWPAGQSVLTSNEALLVGLLLLVAAAGKSALVPFSGWLPRAMEGPTPSSAIFYGALSVHLGAFLLLRVSPILEQSMLLSGAVVAIGLASAIFGSIASSVQSDVKSALSFSSLTQVGIITVEIGLGFRYLPLVHMIGHACLRTLQLLRAPTLLKDYHNLENAVGGHLQSGTAGWERRLPESLRVSIYRLGFERGGFDAILNRAIVRPFLTVFRWCDRMERRWTDLLTGASSRESDNLPLIAPAPGEDEG